MRIPIDPDGRNVEIQTPDGVAAPSLLSTSLLFGIPNDDIEGRSAFDAGCGSGYLGVGLLARGAVSLCASDISQQAVDAATSTAARNGFGNTSDFRQGDLFQPFGDNARFGLVVANPPQTPSAMIEPGRARTHADGGESGRDLLLRVLEETSHHLDDGGILYLATTTLAHPDHVVARAHEIYSTLEVAAHHEVPFDAWRLRHMPFLTDQVERGLAQIPRISGHPYYSIDILRCCQPKV